MDLNQFVVWVSKESKGERNVTIKIQKDKEPHITVGEWLEGTYFCQIVKNIEEIDLEEEQKKQELKTLNKLMEKYDMWST